MASGRVEGRAVSTAVAIITGPAPTYEAARDALIELFVMAASLANYQATMGKSQDAAEELFATVMRGLLEVKP